MPTLHSPDSIDDPFKPNSYLVTDVTLEKRPFSLSSYLFAINDDISSWLSKLKLLVLLSWINYKKRPISYIILFVTFIFVIFSILISFSVLNQLPYVILKLGEKAVGKFDLVFHNNRSILFNASLISSIVKHDDSLGLFTYKLDIPISGFQKIDIQNDNDIYFKNRHISQLPRLVLFIDPDQEFNMNIGPDWRHYFQDDNDVVIDENTSAHLNISVGNRVSFTLFTSAIPYLFLPEIKIDSFFTVTGVVKGVVPSTQGHDIRRKRFLFMNARRLSGLLESHAPNEFDKNMIRSLSLDFIATRGILTMPLKERKKVFSKTSVKSLEHDIMKFITKVYQKLGLLGFDVLSPIGRYILLVDVLLPIANNVVIILIFTMCFMCFFINSAILMSDVELKRREMGIFRILGASSRMTIGCLVLTVYLMAFSGWVVGVFLSLAFLPLLGILLKKLLDADITLFLKQTPIWISLVFMILTPLGGLISPIIRILSTSINASLTSLSCPNGSDKSATRDPARPILRWRLLIIGVLLLANSLLVTFIFPRSLATFNPTMSLFILMIELMGILCGSSFLVASVQVPYQMLFTYVLFFWEKKALFDMTIRNILLHKSRNGLFIFTLICAMGFIIVLCSSMDAMFEAMHFALLSDVGTDFIFAGHLAYDRMIQIDEYINNNQELRDLIISKGWYISQEKINLLNPSDHSVFDIGRSTEFKEKIHIFSPTYFSSMIDNLIRVSDEKTEGLSLSGYPYNADKLNCVYLSRRYRNLLFPKKTEKEILLHSKLNGRPKTFSMAVVGIIQSIPSAKDEPILWTSLDFIQNKILPGTSLEDFIFSGYNILSKDHDKLIELITPLLNSLGRDVYFHEGEMEFEYLGTIRSALNGLTISCLLLVTLILFFFLYLVMTVNVVFQQYEIGILRSIGMNWFHIFRLYMWEAIVTMLVGLGMSFVVGNFTSAFLETQLSQFLQHTINIEISWRIFLGITAASIVVAIASTIIVILWVKRRSSIAFLLAQ